eukprot:342115-Prorocentrum_minimum.AAC.1
MFPELFGGALLTCADQAIPQWPSSWSLASLMRWYTMRCRPRLPTMNPALKYSWQTHAGESQSHERRWQIPTARTNRARGGDISHMVSAPSFLSILHPRYKKVNKKTRPSFDFSYGEDFRLDSPQ